RKKNVRCGGGARERESQYLAPQRHGLHRQTACCPSDSVDGSVAGRPEPERELAAPVLGAVRRNKQGLLRASSIGPLVAYRNNPCLAGRLHKPVGDVALLVLDGQPAVRGISGARERVTDGLLGVVRLTGLPVGLSAVDGVAASGTSLRCRHTVTQRLEQVRLQFLELRAAVIAEHVEGGNSDAGCLLKGNLCEDRSVLLRVLLVVVCQRFLLLLLWKNCP